ncbi:MATE family efflux transporter [Rickettsiella grylli]|uniref:MATE family efflux transporter n=1 Tax=Rickettsiella grylli TaxID=59196 RepID=UPI0005917D71|nr:MATE family efflux transporter [Rickettsiella grylli]
MTLSIPLIISGIIDTSVGFFSNIFLAHLGAASLAAGALVNWVFTTLMVIIWGTLSAITTLVARYYGAQKNTEIASVFFAGLFMAIVLMLPAMLLLWNLSPLFLFFGQAPTTVKLAQFFLHGLTWAIIPDFIITVLLQFVAGLGRTKINLTFSLLFVPLSIFFNYSLMFGKFGFPNLGIAGIGWGAAITFWIITLGFCVYFCFNKTYRLYFKWPRLKKIIPQIYEIFEVGLPLGFTYFFEVGFFLVMSLLMGRVNADTLSANQITLQFFWLFSIVTFALAQGITIRIGHNVGQNNKKALNNTTTVGIFYASAFMFGVAILYWFFPEKLISIDFNINDTNNANIVHLAKTFLGLAAFVQLFEAPRFVLFGALRGLKDTRFTLLTSILVFWVIALPLGSIALSYGFSSHAIWWATILAEMIGLFLLSWQYHRKINALLFHPR